MSNNSVSMDTLIKQISPFLALKGRNSEDREKYLVHDKYGNGILNGSLEPANNVQKLCAEENSNVAVEPAHVSIYDKVLAVIKSEERNESQARSDSLEDLRYREIKNDGDTFLPNENKNSNDVKSERIDSTDTNCRTHIDESHLLQNFIIQRDSEMENYDDKQMIQNMSQNENNCFGSEEEVVEGHETTVEFSPSENCEEKQVILKFSQTENNCFGAANEIVDGCDTCLPKQNYNTQVPDVVQSCHIVEEKMLMDQQHGLAHPPPPESKSIYQRPLGAEHTQIDTGMDSKVRVIEIRSDSLHQDNESITDSKVRVIEIRSDSLHQDNESITDSKVRVIEIRSNSLHQDNECITDAISVQNEHCSPETKNMSPQLLVAEQTQIDPEMGSEIKTVKLISDALHQDAENIADTTLDVKEHCSVENNPKLSSCSSSELNTGPVKINRSVNDSTLSNLVKKTLIYSGKIAKVPCNAINETLSRFRLEFPKQPKKICIPTRLLCENSIKKSNYMKNVNSESNIPTLTPLSPAVHIYPKVVSLNNPSTNNTTRKQNARHAPIILRGNKRKPNCVKSLVLNSSLPSAIKIVSKQVSVSGFSPVQSSGIYTIASTKIKPLILNSTVPRMNTLILPSMKHTLPKMAPLILPSNQNKVRRSFGELSVTITQPSAPKASIFEIPATSTSSSSPILPLTPAIFKISTSPVEESASVETAEELSQGPKEKEALDTVSKQNVIHDPSSTNEKVSTSTGTLSTTNKYIFQETSTDNKLNCHQNADAYVCQQISSTENNPNSVKNVDASKLICQEISTDSILNSLENNDACKYICPEPLTDIKVNFLQNDNALQTEEGICKEDVKATVQPKQTDVTNAKVQRRRRCATYEDTTPVYQAATLVRATRSRRILPKIGNELLETNEQTAKILLPKRRRVQRRKNTLKKNLASSNNAVDESDILNKNNSPISTNVHNTPKPGPTYSNSFQSENTTQGLAGDMQHLISTAEKCMYNSSNMPYDSLQATAFMLHNNANINSNLSTSMHQPVRSEHTPKYQQSYSLFSDRALHSEFEDFSPKTDPSKSCSLRASFDTMGKGFNNFVADNQISPLRGQFSSSINEEENKIQDTVSSNHIESTSLINPCFPSGGINVFSDCNNVDNCSPEFNDTKKLIAGNNLNFSANKYNCDNVPQKLGHESQLFKQVSPHEHFQNNNRCSENTSSVSEKNAKESCTSAQQAALSKFYNCKPQLVKYLHQTVSAKDGKNVQKTVLQKDYQNCQRQTITSKEEICTEKTKVRRFERGYKQRRGRTRGPYKGSARLQPDKPYICSYCGKSEQYNAILKRHMELEHGFFAAVPNEVLHSMQELQK